MNMISKISSEISTTQDYLAPIPHDWSAELALGNSLKATDWKNVPAKDLDALIALFTDHKEGSKDGLAVTQGTTFASSRKNETMDTLFIISVDVDNGTPCAEIDQKINPAVPTNRYSVAESIA